MRMLRRFSSRLRAWTRTTSDEARLRAEIDEHVAILTEENINAGLSPVEARRQALLKFGPIEAIKESYRDKRTFTSVETLLQDIRYALRRLKMAPTFTVATVLTLALGIGATTSIFSLVNAVLLKSLAVASPGELYRLGRESRCCYLGGYSQDREFSLVSYELYEYLRDNSQGFAELAAFQSGQLQFGVRRAGEVDAARSYPGEFV
ncbi:MAG TPA: permease prefix domain 1-containing protein, partial [Vicinamibacterales bacterium]